MPPTPFMGLTLPTVGITLGPAWATELNAALTQVDSHNHTVGQGVPVPTSGISVDADFPFNNFNAILLRSTNFANQSSPLALVTDIGCLYVSGGNLWYNNQIGQQVQITQGAGLDASTVGGFGGDYGTSTASAFYTSVSSTFTFWQASNKSALMDVGPLILHNTSSTATGITFQAPNPLASSYTLTLPNFLPASTKILTVDNAGNIGDVYDVDNTTIQVSSNTLQVAPFSIGPAQRVALNFTQSGSSGAFSNQGVGVQQPTNLSVNLTCSGRPIMLLLSNDQTGNESYVGIREVNIGGGASNDVECEFRIDGQTIGKMLIGIGAFNTTNNLQGRLRVPPTSFSQFYSNPSAANHNFQFIVNNSNGNYATEVQFCTLIVYEL